MSDTLKLIRIEKDGIGIFRNRESPVYESPTYWRYIKRHADFPTPEEENLEVDAFDKEWFCAYYSIKEMQKRLTNKDIQYLIKNDFQVLLIEVTKFQKGKYQALFLPESIIKTENITFLFV